MGTLLCWPQQLLPAEHGARRRGSLVEPIEIFDPVPALEANMDALEGEGMTSELECLPRR